MGKTIDTSKKFTVVTQFLTSDNTADGDLIEVRRVWVQDGVVYKNSNAKLSGLTGNSLTDAFCEAENKLFGGDDTFKAHGGMFFKVVSGEDTRDLIESKLSGLLR